MNTVKDVIKTVLGATLAAFLVIALVVLGYQGGQMQIVMGCLVNKKFDYRGHSFDCAIFVEPAVRGAK